MLESIKKWFGLSRVAGERESRRQASLARVRSYGHVANLSGFKCHLCDEETYEMYSLKTVTSPTGENFTKHHQRIGYMCARCTTVSHWSDVSDYIPLSRWDGKKIDCELYLPSMRSLHTLIKGEVKGEE